MATGTIRRLMRVARGNPPSVLDGLTRNMRTIVSESKKSVHATNSVVSEAPGLLWGFIVVSAGSSGTMTVYDNASAASGTILRSVSASELVRGAWIYCGQNGINASNGIYVALGGSTAPIVCAVFQGTYPTISHSGTVRYIDGTNGNDAWDGTVGTWTSGTTGPKKTWTNDLETGNWHVYCKRGTSITISNADLDHTGTDWLVEDYGDTALAKPVLEQSASKTNSWSFIAATGNIEFRNVRVVSLRSSHKSGGGFNVPAGARLICRNTESDNFATGHLFNGSYAILDNVIETNCTNGAPQASNSYAAPSYSIIMNSSLTADSDAYSLHNGTGLGYGNVCISSTLSLDPDFVPGTGGSEPENAVDLNGTNSVSGGFRDTLVAFCTINGSLQLASDSSTPRGIASDEDCDGVAIVANLVNAGVAAGVQLRAPNWTFTGNVVKTVTTTSKGEAACISVGAATGLIVLNNYLYMSDDGNKPMVDWSGASDGVFKNNILESDNTTQSIYNMGSGVIAGWNSGSFANNNYYAPSVTGTTTFATITGGGGAQTLAAFDASYAAGSETNIDPNLGTDYQLPGGSSLIGAGADLSDVCYIGYNGPFWIYGNPSVGVDDPQWT